jgi:predicted nucleic acid-binding protein
VTLLVDTSVWSLAFRRDVASGAPEVSVLRRALDSGEAIVTTGLILQELLQATIHFTTIVPGQQLIIRFGNR